jgi:hypothetical protein
MRRCKAPWLTNADYSKTIVKDWLMCKEWRKPKHMKCLTQSLAADTACHLFFITSKYMNRNIVEYQYKPNHIIDVEGYRPDRTKIGGSIRGIKRLPRRTILEEMI